MQYKATSILQYADDITKHYTHEKQKLASRLLKIGIEHVAKGTINGKYSSTREKHYLLSSLDKH